MKRHRIEVIDRTYAAILAAKSPAARIASADAAHRSASSMLRNRVAQLFPESTDEHKHLEYLRRLLGHGADGYLATRR